MGYPSLELWVWHHREGGRKPDRRVPLHDGARLIVGRDRYVDVCVPDIRVNRRHFEVRRGGARVWLTDLNSRSGTWLNDEQIRGPTLISLCDSITIVGVEFRVVRSMELVPAWLLWNDGTVPRLAQGIYEGRRFEDMPILHDALIDAGCDNQDILHHCKSPGPHVRGCWVVDLLLGKE
jgi:hypothetical protein